MQEEFFLIQHRTLENHVLYFLIHVILLFFLTHYFSSPNNEILPNVASSDIITTFSSSFWPPQLLHTPP